MSKMGNFVVDMYTDAVDMTLQEFTDKYGNHNSYVWTQARFGEYLLGDEEPYCYPGSDPQE